MTDYDCADIPVCLSGEYTCCSQDNFAHINAYFANHGLNTFAEEIQLALNNVDSEIVDESNVIRKGWYKHVFRSLDFGFSYCSGKEEHDRALPLCVCNRIRKIYPPLMVLTWVTKKTMLHYSTIQVIMI